ncbi:MAG: DNA double-strand break repair nuclease NurA [Cyanobacteria bacterium P01_C01_bin.89]
MLDFVALAKQMQGIGDHLTQEAIAAREKVTEARSLLKRANATQSELLEIFQRERDTIGFTAAEPIESLDTREDIAPAPDAHTILATDGSQIAPSHHEIAYCYLVNTGRIALHYGQGRQPSLNSQPEVFYKNEDLYLSRQWGIGTEEWMGYQRMVAEAEVLAELGVTEAARKDGPRSPLLAMVDGSLIFWFLEPLPRGARERILPPILNAWDRLRLSNVPMMGYISASRSGEAMNFLRFASCIFEQWDSDDDPDSSGGDKGGSNKGSYDPKLEPMKDTLLWAEWLEPGQRGPLWRSSSQVLQEYRTHPIYFCYVNVGVEIARIEVPEWLAVDTQKFNQALSLMLAQVQKGYGYPVALAEAHNQAVVRGGDRTRFFLMLERAMVAAGLKNVGTSYKEARKRGSIA